MSGLEDHKPEELAEALRKAESDAAACRIMALSLLPYVTEGDTLLNRVTFLNFIVARIRGDLRSIDQDVETNFHRLARKD